MPGGGVMGGAGPVGGPTCDHVGECSVRVLKCLLIAVCVCVGVCVRVFRVRTR